MSEAPDKKIPWDGRILGVSRKRRFQVYGWSAMAMVVASLVWTWFHIRPDRWYTYTDQVSFQKVARDVQPGFVLWETSEILHRFRTDQYVGASLLLFGSVILLFMYVLRLLSLLSRD